MTSSKGFQHHFNIISNFFCHGCYMKKNPAFALISFAVLKWHECLSFQLPFELTVEIPVQLHLELEVNLLVCSVVEREIERERVQMKPPDILYNYLRIICWQLLTNVKRSSGNQTDGSRYLQEIWSECQSEKLKMIPVTRKNYLCKDQKIYASLTKQFNM